MGRTLLSLMWAQIVATSALGVAAGLGLAGVIVPMSMAGLGVVASIIGTFFVNTKEDASPGNTVGRLKKRGAGQRRDYLVASFFLVKWTLGSHNLGFYWSIIFGLLAGIIIGIVTEYYTLIRL